MSLFAEIRQRNVFRVAAAYAVAAWLVLQLADILLDNFDAPAWVFKSLVVFLAVGFVVAMLLSWAFELTPEGVKRAAEVTPPAAWYAVSVCCLSRISALTRTTRSSRAASTKMCSRACRASTTCR